MRMIDLQIGSLTAITPDASGALWGADNGGAFRPLTASELLMAALMTWTMELLLPPPGTDTSTPGYQLAEQVVITALADAMIHVVGVPPIDYSGSGA